MKQELVSSLTFLENSPNGQHFSGLTTWAFGSQSWLLLFCQDLFYGFLPSNITNQHRWIKATISHIKFSSIKVTAKCTKQDGGLKIRLKCQQKWSLLFGWLHSKSKGTQRFSTICTWDAKPSHKIVDPKVYLRSCAWDLGGIPNMTQKMNWVLQHFSYWDWCSWYLSHFILESRVVQIKYTLFLFKFNGNL